MPPIRSAEQSFSPQYGSVGAARRFLTALLENWGEQTLVWPAQLALSELATNSVLHAGTVFTIGVHLLPDGAVRVEVGDGSRRVPRQRRYEADATTGRGVSLVAGLARDWGVELIPAGKVVWCELVADADARGAASPEASMDLADVRLDDWLADDDRDGGTNLRHLGEPRLRQARPPAQASVLPPYRAAA